MSGGGTGGAVDGFPHSSCMSPPSLRLMCNHSAGGYHADHPVVAVSSHSLVHTPLTTMHSGAYHADHPVVALFWQALATFSDPERRALLRFVTSCSRAPLLGFRSVYVCLSGHHHQSSMG